MPTSKLKMTLGMSTLKRAELENHEWFIEYKNTDTRNAIAQGLELVDHAGDSIFYNGKSVPGFRVSFNQVLYLLTSKSKGDFKFVSYHRVNRNMTWKQWKENTKTGKDAVVGFKRKKIISKV